MDGLKPQWRFFYLMVEKMASAFYPAVITSFVILLRPEWYDVSGFAFWPFLRIFLPIFLIHQVIALPIFGWLAKRGKLNIVGLTGAGLAIGFTLSFVLVITSLVFDPFHDVNVWREALWSIVFSVLASWFSWIMAHIT